MAEPELDAFGRYKNPEDARKARSVPGKGETYDLTGAKVDALGVASKAPVKRTSKPKAQDKAE